MPDDPRLPTLHLPGSPEKIAVLTARAALGLPLFNAQDAVDCMARRRRPEVRRQRGMKPATLAKAALVKLGRSLGKSDSQMSREIGCNRATIAILAKLA